ncbi:MAG TPA: lysophospholipid acyltransferase family protein [Acidimicrobiia bacterium]|nr:lysophospholipid acyltransferase family protein [Acidimicrobiia bacterium]
MYWIVKAVLTPIIRLLVRVKVEGREHVPRRGAVILAANHRSFLDSIFIPLVVHRRVTFVAKAEYFDDPKTAWFFRSCGQIPIRREGGTASERALASATEVLRNGKVFAIYPEGTRTRDGLLHRGHTGVARLALGCNVPIVPVGLIGTDDVQPIDSRLPKLFRHVTIRFGEPIDPARYAGRENDRMALRELTDEVMYEICQLSGYEYVDTYATKQAEDIPTETARVASFVDVRTPDTAAS